MFQIISYDYENLNSVFILSWKSLKNMSLRQYWVWGLFWVLKELFVHLEFKSWLNKVIRIFFVSVLDWKIVFLKKNQSPWFFGHQWNLGISNDASFIFFKLNWSGCHVIRSIILPKQLRYVCLGSTLQAHPWAFYSWARHLA